MAKKICGICNKRPIDNSEVIIDLCRECRVEGEWENMHSDDSHEEMTQIIAKLETAGAVELRKLASKAGVKNGGKFKSAELRGMIRAQVEKVLMGTVENTLNSCWVCDPGLNEAKMEDATIINHPKAERASRKGQVITVPLKAPGEVKAQVVIKAAGEERANLTVRKTGEATLDVDLNGVTLHLAWDADGRYAYAEAFVLVGGKKKAVRNVAEALRIIKR